MKDPRIDSLEPRTCIFCSDEILGDRARNVWHVWKYHRDEFIKTFEEGYNDEPKFMKLLWTKQEQYEKLIEVVKQIDEEEESMK